MWHVHWCVKRGLVKIEEWFCGDRQVDRTIYRLLIDNGKTAAPFKIRETEEY